MMPAKFFIQVITGFFMMTVAAYAGGESCFIVSDLATRKILVQEGDCTQRVTPASTFKIPLSLMGYDAEILEDASRPVWPYKPEYPGWLSPWRREQTPSSWIRYSCVWYSQEITRLLGMERFEKYVRAFEYGNQDVSGDKKQDNGLTHSWLSSSLLISPLEQVIFLHKMLKHELPVSPRSYSMTTHLLYLGPLENDWQLYGKTGSGFQLYADGARNTSRQSGWFVGWVAKNDRTLIFAQLLQDRKKEADFAGPRAKEEALWKLKKMLKKM